MNPTTKEPHSLRAYGVAVDALRALRPLLVAIARSDGSLADQLRRAAPAIVLNLAEGSRRRGRDRTFHYRVAAGSADEAKACLDVAEALGYVDADEVAVARGRLDAVLGMLWPLTR
jgi:four helix bundle protein